VAKVVAVRKFGRMRERGTIPSKDKNRRRRKWHILSGERQTDKLFDHEIVDRMGAEFYRDTFEPAVREAARAGPIVRGDTRSPPPALEAGRHRLRFFERIYPSHRRTSEARAAGGSGSGQRAHASTAHVPPKLGERHLITAAGSVTRRGPGPAYAD
jgi:hypothetical protein